MGRTRTLPAAADADVGDDRRFVTALARGLKLLACFRPQDHWLGHHELVRRTGLPHATVSRLAFTLVALGYLRHRAATGEYALSPAVLALGFSMLSNFDIGRIARPVMQALAHEVQAAVSLGVRHDLSMVYVTHCRGAARLTLGLDVGARLPLPETAMGRAVLCALPEADRERLFRRLEAEAPDAWPRRRDGVLRALATWRARGFTLSEAEWEHDISAVGVAVHIGDGREPLGLTIGGPSSYLKGRFLRDELGPRLVHAGREIADAVHAGAWRDAV